MFVGRYYSAIDFFRWTFKETVVILIYVSIPTILYAYEVHFISIPWAAIAILGTALSFIVGFKNNASYDRIWEARTIYGAIINDSRSFAYTVRDTIGVEHISMIKDIFYRHFAWLTALRYQLREPRNWENTKNKTNIRYMKYNYSVPEWSLTIESELQKYLKPEELQYIMTKKNRATQLSALQSAKLLELKNAGVINDFQWMTIQNILTKHTDNQGKAERIKNFPYPRNFSSITRYLMMIFAVLVPYGLLKEYSMMGDGTVIEGMTIWINIPISTAVIWVFMSLDRIGEGSVNPFEGGSNDVPITQISRAIEIDMRDMLNEQPLPIAIEPKNSIVL